MASSCVLGFLSIETVCVNAGPGPSAKPSGLIYSRCKHLRLRAPSALAIAATASCASTRPWQLPPGACVAADPATYADYPFQRAFEI